MLLVTALLARASGQDNNRPGSGTNSDKDSGSKSFKTDSKLFANTSLLNKGDGAVAGANRKPHSKQEDEKDFRESFQFVSTMFYSLQ